MISFTYESLFRQDSIDKQLEITGTGISLTNTDIYQNSFELSEELNTSEDLTFGSFVSSCLKFTTSAIGSSFIGKTLTVKMVVDGHTGTKLSLGTYTVTEEKWTADRTKKEITAYDSLYDVANKDMTSWYNSLTFPITVKNFRNSFFSNVGITQISTTLINDSVTINKSIDPQKLSGGDVLRVILQFNGVFGRIKRTNSRFEYKTLATTSVYNITPSMYTDCIYEDYATNVIDKVIIRQEENDLGGQAGNGDNALIIQGNFLAYGSQTPLDSIAENILNTVSVVTYVPATISVVGNPCVEAGDLVTVTKRDGTTFNTFVLSRKLTGEQALKDEYVSTGNKNRVNDLNTFGTEYLQLLGKTNILNRTLDETISQVGELGNAVTTIRQDTDSLEFQVESLQQQVDGETQYYEREGTPTKLNYPYWDFTYAIPCNGTIRLDEIYDDKMREGGDKFPHFTYTDEDLKHFMRALCVDTRTGKGYRFLQENDVWLWKEIADSDWSILYNRISELEITIDGIEANVSNVEVSVSNLGTQVTQNTTNITTTANGLSAEITRAQGIESNLSSSITLTNSNLASEVSRATNAENGLSNSITSEASRATQAERSLSALITATASAITTQVSETYQTISGMNAYYDSDYIDGHYYNRSQMSNTFYTKSQTNTQIQQTASTITQQVNTTLEDYSTTSQMTAFVQQTASTINLNVSRNYQTKSAMSSYYTSSQTDNRYFYYSSAQILIEDVGELDNQISAKLSKTSPSGQTSFSWQMTDSKMEWKQNGNQIMLLNSSGLKINGEVNAISGKIGSGNDYFTIGSKSIYNGITSISDTTHEGVYIGTDGIKTKNFLLLPSGYMSYDRGLIGSAEKGFWISEDANGYEYLRSGLLSIDDTLHDGVYLGANGIALGKGKFKITNEGELTAVKGNLGGWDFSQNGYLSIYNNNDVVANIYGGTNGDLQFSSKDITNTSRTFEVQVGSPQGSQSEGVVSFTSSGGAHAFIVDMANISLNGDVAINNGKITNTNQHLTLFASSEANYSAELGVQDSKWAFMPSVNGKLYLGTQNHKWDTVYAQTGTINTSDRKEKENIEVLDTEISDFVLKLKPVSYKFKVGERTHFGLIAQDVEEVMKEIGWTDKDFAGFCKDGDSYGLRYEEFISPLIKVVQDQQKEIETLRSEIAEIKKLLKGV